MNILSLDLSTKSSGWAVFKDKVLTNYGCITSASTDLIKRIHVMTDGLEKIIIENNIEKIIVEEVRPDAGGGNLQTHRALMWLQTALAFLVHDNFKTIEIEYIYPSSWRAKCGIKNGRGIKRETLKEADIRFVKETYGIDVNDDTADAIAIGHSQLYESKDSGDLNWE